MPTDKETPSTYPKLKIIIPLLLGVILLLFTAVYLFTKDSFISGFNVSDKGAIGDAINGITAPIISLIAAALIFYSFLSQIEANKIQMKSNQMLQAQWQFDTYYKLFTEIDKAFTDLSITITTKKTTGTITETHQSVGYIRYMTDNLDMVDSYVAAGFLGSIDFILEDIVVLINYVQESNIQQKDFFLRRIDRFYTTFLEEPLHELTSRLSKKERHFQRYFSIYEQTLNAISKMRRDLDKDLQSE